MSQEDILKYLKNNKIKEITIKELAKNLNVGRVAINHNLLSLFRQGLIKRRLAGGRGKKYLYITHEKH